MANIEASIEINMFDIVYADLGCDIEDECSQRGKRPCVVVQNEIGCKYSPTVIILPLTSKLKKIHQPTHTILHRSKVNGLNKTSMVLAEQVSVISKEKILYKIGRLEEKDYLSVLGAYMANVTGVVSNYIPGFNMAVAG